MHLQQFGKIETPQGDANAMLCIDRDRPKELMIHWWGENIQSNACCFSVETVGEQLRLTPGVIYRESPEGMYYPPPEEHLSPQELSFRSGVECALNVTGGYCSGQWSMPGESAREIRFSSPFADEHVIEAEECDSWEELKSWMDAARFNRRCSLFRGHGNNTYTLRTSLSRAGRHRLDRYCGSELRLFASQAEAALGIRLDLDDEGDYGTCLGLAQHHSLPTPMLDWTSSPYVAAFFAFADAFENPESIDQRKVRIYALTRDFVAGAAPSKVVVPRHRPYLSFLAIAPRLNARLQAQQGHFLVTNVGDIERYIRSQEIKQNRRVAYAVDIPASLAADALEDLAFMGLTAATLFPGMDGVARSLRHRMGFKQHDSI